jgi:hypothetical protein
MSVSPQPRPSLSSTLLGKKLNQRPGIKLAPSIASARIISTLKRHDQKIWYSIIVTPRNELPHRRIIRAPYTIFRRYEDFLAFSSKLQEIVGPTPSESSRIPKSPRANKYKKSLTTAFVKDTASPVVTLPKLKSRIVLFVTKQDSSQRREDLDRFLNSVFRLPDDMLKSLPVLEFFGIDKSDMEHKVHHDMSFLSPESNHVNLNLAPEPYARKASAPSKIYSIVPPPMLSRSCSTLAVKVRTSSVKKAISNPNFNNDAYVGCKPGDKNLNSTLYTKAQRSQTRLLSAPSATTHQEPSKSTSTASGSPQSIHFASKDEMFNDAPAAPIIADITVSPLEVPLSPNPKLSLSAPAPRKNHIHQRHVPFPKSKNESPKYLDNELLDSVPIASLQRSFSTPAIQGHAKHMPIRNIRIKIIYDLDNIIILQVPRTIPLDELETKIANKLSNVDQGSNFKSGMSLLYYGKQRTSHEHSQNLRPSDAYRIMSRKDLAYAMMWIWHDLEKVTVRLMIGM